MLVSVVIVVATINAVNFVDGLDGLASGVVGIGAVAFFAFSYKLADANGESLAITAALLCAALGGACVGFLPHNFFPARIFMGDSGSMLIGLVLAGSALTLTGQFATVDMSRGAGEAEASLLPTLLPIVLPISILVVPFADLVLAVIRRTRAGRVRSHRSSSQSNARAASTCSTTRASASLTARLRPSSRSRTWTWTPRRCGPWTTCAAARRC